jgi:hypothetical protein
MALLGYMASFATSTLVIFHIIYIMKIDINNYIETRKFYLFNYIIIFKLKLLN